MTHRTKKNVNALSMLDLNKIAYVRLSLRACSQRIFHFALSPGMPSSSLWWHHAVKGVCLCISGVRVEEVLAVCSLSSVCVFVGKSYFCIRVFRLFR